MLLTTGSVVLALSLLAGYITNRLWISEALICLVVGVALRPLLEAVGEGGILALDRFVALEEATRVTLGIAVMGVALRLPAGFMRRYWRDLAIVIVPGLILMWLTGTALAMGLLGMTILPALLLGAIVAPTDPVVASSIVGGKLAERSIPARVRSLISGESGANDGLALLFVMLPLLLLTKPQGEAIADWGLRILLWSVIGGASLGAAAGWATGRLFVWVKRQPLAEAPSLLSIALALALTVLAAVRLIGGDGILAVFVAGLVFSRRIAAIEASRNQLHGAITRFFDLPAFVLIGISLPWAQWRELGWQGIAFVASLVAFRRLPWWLLLSRWLRAIRRREEAVFAGWFGPIGVAAAYYAMLAARETHIDVLWPAASLAILASVLLHGVSATPLAGRMGRLAPLEEAGADAQGSAASLLRRPAAASEVHGGADK